MPSEGTTMPSERLKILLAIDDSKFSDAALRTLAAEHNPAKTAVRVLHVVEPVELPYYPELTAPYPISLNDIRKRRMQEGRRLVERAAARLRAAGFQVEAAVRPGQVRAVAVDVAAKWRADLIVVGSHGRRGLARVLLGSVSDYIAHHAPCSVEIVRMKRGKR
jgi:nucleotide-binding universal stress UspA family protein